MKDILFLVPIYYSPRFVDRFRHYLLESKTSCSYDVYFCCSNAQIAEETEKKAKQYGYIFQERDNFGGGEGALWFLQKKSGIGLSQYRYIWYYEESCEPIRRDWIDRLVNDMDKGATLVGWDWHLEAKKRHGQIKHEFYDRQGNKIIAHENTKDTGTDAAGNTLEKTWDTPGYRDETFVVSSKDFLEFEYPDASVNFWEKWGGFRSYGVRAERMWWKVEEQNFHGFQYSSPNIQWFVLTKHNHFPSRKNIYYWYFRELPWRIRKNPEYMPPPLCVRVCLCVLERIWLKFYGLFIKINRFFDKK